MCSCVFVACRLTILSRSVEFSSSMLAISRSTRVAPRFSLHTRALSAAAQNAGSLQAPATTECPDSNTAPASTAKGQQQRRTRRANTSVECMFVYPWNGIRSSAEGLAIARAVQDKYGPAKEVVFPRVRLHLQYETSLSHLAPVHRRFTDCIFDASRTQTASTTSSSTFGSCLTTRTCASASRRNLRSLASKSRTCLGAMGTSASKK